MFPALGFVQLTWTPRRVPRKLEAALSMSPGVIALGAGK